MTDKPKHEKPSDGEGCIEGFFIAIGKTAAAVTLAGLILLVIYLLYNIAANTGGLRPLF